MLDDGEVDDKIIAVLKDDPVYSMWNDVTEFPPKVIDSLKHYFLTYKEIPGASKKAKIEITDTYGREEAEKIIELSCKDYTRKIRRYPPALALKFTWLLPFINSYQKLLIGSFFLTKKSVSLGHFPSDIQPN